MHESIVMKVYNGRKDLLHHFGSSSFWKYVGVFYGFEEISSLTNVHNQNEIILPLVNLVEAIDVWMVKSCWNGNFINYFFLMILFFLNCWNRDNLSCSHYACFLHFYLRYNAIGPLPYVLQMMVVLQIVLFPDFHKLVSLKDHTLDLASFEVAWTDLFLKLGYLWILQTASIINVVQVFFIFCLVFRMNVYHLAFSWNKRLTLSFMLFNY